MQTKTGKHAEPEYTVYGSLQAVADGVRTWWARAVKEYGLVETFSRLVVVGSIFYALVAVWLFFSGPIARMGLAYYFDGHYYVGPVGWAYKGYGAFLVVAWLASAVVLAFLMAFNLSKDVGFRKLWDDPPVVFGTPRSGKSLSEQQSLENRVGETL